MATSLAILVQNDAVQHNMQHKFVQIIRMGTTKILVSNDKEEHQSGADSWE